MRKLTQDWATIVKDKSTPEHLKEDGKQRLGEIVILVSILMRNIIKEKGSLREILETQLDLTNVQFQQLHNYLDEHPKNIVIICDGLDEFSAAHSCHILEIIQGYRSKDIGCVVTCRPHSTQGLSYDVDCEIHLNGFNKDQAKEYVISYIEQINEDASTKISSDKLWNQIDESPDLLQLSKNPSILHLMCVTYTNSDDIKLGSTTASVFEDYTFYLLNDYHQKHMKEHPDEKHFKKKQIMKKYHEDLYKMGELALQGLKSDHLSLLFSVDEVQDKVGERAFELGFITNVPNSDLVVFHHKSIQEYLAAFYVKFADKEKGIDVFLEFCTTAEHLMSSHVILNFILSMSSKLHRQVSKAIGNIISTMEPNSTVSSHERTQFLLTMLKDNRKLKFPLPKEVFLDLRNPAYTEKSVFQSKSLVELFSQQKPDGVRSVHIISKSGKALKSLKELTKASVTDLKFDFVHQEPYIDDLKPFVSQKLKTLNFYHGEFTDKHISKLVSHCHSNVTLSFYECTVSATGLLDLQEFSHEKPYQIRAYPECQELGPILTALCQESDYPWNENESVEIKDEIKDENHLGIFNRIAQKMKKLNLLSLENCNISASESFAEGIANCDKLTKLRMVKCETKNQSDASLFSNEKVVRRLKELDLVDSKFSVESALKDMCNIFKKGPGSALEKLNLGQNDMTKALKSCKQLLPYLKNLGEFKMEEANLQCNINTRHFIKDLLFQCKKLHVLDLSHNTLGSENIVALSKGITKETELEILLMGKCELENESFNVQSNWTENYPWSKTFDLTLYKIKLRKGNSITAAGELAPLPKPQTTFSAYLAEVPEVMSQITGFTGQSSSQSSSESMSPVQLFLTKLKIISEKLCVLDISGTKLSSKDINTFTEVLKSLTKLHTLAISKCYCGGQPVFETFVDTLRALPSLKEVSLDGNKFYPQSIVKLHFLRKRNIEIAYPDCSTEDGDQLINLLCQTEDDWLKLEQLNLSGCCVTKDGSEALLVLVPYLENLDTLFLPKNLLTKDTAMNDYLKKIPKTGKLKHMDLSDNECGENSVVSLHEILKSSPLLESLKMNRCNLPDGEEIVSLVDEILTSCHSIAALSMTDNDVHCEAVVVLTLINRKNMTEIDYPNCKSNLFRIFKADFQPWEGLVKINEEKLKASEMSALSRAAHCMEKLETIDLAYVDPLAYSKLNVFLQKLPETKHLKTMKMTGNILGEESVEILVKHFQQSEELTNVYLDKCELSSEAFQKVAQALSKCEHIEVIDISNNKMMPNDGKLVADILKTKKNLLELHITNFSVDESFRDIANQLSKCCRKVKVLEFAGNDLNSLVSDGSDVDALFDLCKETPDLQKLGLSQCNFHSNKYVEKLIKNLHECCLHLEYVDFSKNCLGPHSFVLLVLLEQRNKQKNESLIRIKYPKFIDGQNDKLNRLCLEGLKKWTEPNLKLIFSEGSLSEEDVEALSLIVHETKYLTEFVVTCKTENTAMFSDVLEKLKLKSEQLQVLNLSNNEINDISSLLNILETSDQLVNLQLVNSKLKETKSIVENALENLPHITNFDISGNALDSETIKTFSDKGMTNWGEMKQLSLEHCDINDMNDEVLDLVKAIKTGCPKLTKLGLKNNKLSPLVLARLTELRHERNCRVTYPECYPLDSECVVSLITEQENKWCEQTNLSVADSSQDSIVAIAEVLPQMESLHTLDIQNSLGKDCLTDQLACDLIQVIPNQVKTLALSKNHFSEQAIKSAKEKLKTLKNLVYLSIADCKIYESMRDILVSLKEIATNIEMLDISGNQGDYRCQLYDLIKAANKLTFLNLTNCHIHFEQPEVYDSFKDSTKLNNLKLSGNVASPLTLVQFSKRNWSGTPADVLIEYPACTTESSDPEELIKLFKCLPTDWKKQTTFSLFPLADQTNKIFVTSETTEALGQVLFEMENLETLNINNCQFKNLTSVKQMMLSLSNCKNLEKLYFYDSSCESFCLEPLACVIQNTPKIHTISVQGQQCSNSTVTINFLEHVAENCRCLVELNISNNSLKDMVAVASVVENNNSLSILELTNCDVFQEDTQVDFGISKFLKKLQQYCPDLTKLGLGGNVFAPKNYICLVDFCTSKDLVIEYPNHRSSDDEKIKELLQYKTWDKIVEIDTTSSVLSSDGSDALCQILYRAKCLSKFLLGPQKNFNMEELLGKLNTDVIEILDLSQNILDDHVESLSQVISKADIKCLKLEMCFHKCFSTESVVKCLSSKSSNSLSTLSLKDCIAEPVTLVDISVLSSNKQMSVSYPGLETEDSMDLIKLCESPVELWEQMHCLELDCFISNDGLVALGEIIKYTKDLKSVNFNGSKMKDVGYLTRFIETVQSHHKSIETIDLSRNTLNTKTLQAVSELVSTNPNMTKIGLGCCDLQDSSIGTNFLESLTGYCKALTTVLLSECQMNKMSLQQIVELAKKNPMLSELDLSNCNLSTDSPMDELLNLLKLRKNLKLYLTGNTCKPTTIVTLKEFEDSGSTIHYPNHPDDTSQLMLNLLSENVRQWQKRETISNANIPEKFTEWEMHALAMIIKHTSNLKVLQLINCQKSVGIGEIMKTLREISVSLEHFNLSQNIFDSHTFQTLCHLLPLNVKLKELNLAKCHIPNWKLFLQNVPKGQLHLLDLRDNECNLGIYTSISEIKLENKDIVIHFPECKTQNGKKLVDLCKTRWNETRKIDLSDEKINPEGIEALTKVVSHADSLNFFSIAGCEVTNNAVMEKLVEALIKRSKTLTHLDISSNLLDLKGANKLVEVLRGGTDGPKFKYLSIGHCGIHSDSILKDIISGLREYQETLMSLNMSGMKFSNSNGDLMNQLLTSNCMLGDLFFNKSEFSNKMMLKLIETIGNTKIKVLDLHKSEMSSEIMMELTQLKINCPELKLCYPNCNDATHKKFIDLCQGTPEWSKVTSLSLSDSNLSVPCLKVLAKLTKKCPETKLLDLTSINLKMATPSLVSGILNGLENLKTLLLKQCSISEEEMWKAITDFAKEARYLEHINLESNTAFPTTIFALSNIKTSKTKLDITYPDCPTDSTYLVELCETFKAKSEIKLPDEEISGNGIQALLEVTSAMENLTTFDISSCSGNNLAITNELLTVLSQHGQLRVLNLSKRTIMSNVIETFSVFIRSLGHLKELKLAFCEITKDENLESILQAISNGHSELEFLDISGSCVGCKSISVLSTPKLLKIPNIVLSKCNLPKDANTLEFVSKLKESNVKQLDLSGNVANLDLILALNSIVHSKPTITVKFPEWDDECKDILNLIGITEEKTLESFDHLTLKKNKLKQNQMIGICNIVSKLPVLREVQLNENEYVTGMEQLLNSVATHMDTIATLDLSDSTFTKDSCQVIANIICNAPSLAKVSLQKCNLDKVFLTEMQAYDTIQSNKMASLDFSKNFCGCCSSELNPLHILLNKRSLESLSFLDCDLTFGKDLSKMVEMLFEQCEARKTLNMQGNKCSLDVLASLSKKGFEKQNVQITMPEIYPPEDTQVVEILTNYRSWKLEKKFKISNIKFFQSVISALETSLECMKNLQTFQMSSCTCGEDIEFGRIFDVGLSSPSLAVIDLSGTNIGNSNMDGLCRSLTKVKNLTDLLLSHCNISSVEVLSTLFKRLRDSCQLISNLNLSFNKIEQDIYQIDLFPNKPSFKSKLKTFDISNCHMNMHSCAYGFIQKLKKHCEEIRSIKMDGNRLPVDAIVLLKTLSLNFDGTKLVQPLHDVKCEKLKQLVEYSPDQWPNLEELTDLNFSYQSEVNALAEITSLTSSLKHISMESNEKGLTFGELLSCLGSSGKSIQKLNLTSLGREDNEVLNALLGQTKNITELHLVNCVKQDKLLLETISTKFNLLTDLNLSKNKICPSGIQALQEMTKNTKDLQKLRLRNCGIDNSKRVTELIVSLFENCSKLELIDLSQNSIHINVHILLTKKTRASKLNPHIIYPECDNIPEEIIDLSHQKPDSWEEWENITIHNQTINRDGMEALSDIIKNMANLRGFNISGCDIPDMQITSVLSVMAKYCPHLTELDLGKIHLDADSIKSITKLLTETKDISRICIPGCQLQKQPEILKLMECIQKHCQSLKWLDMSSNDLQTDVIALLTWLKTNRQTDFPDYPSCSNTQLLPLLKGEPDPWPQIQTLDFSNISSLTAEDIYALNVMLSCASELTKLKLGKKNLTRDQLDRLIPDSFSDKVPKLKELNLSNNNMEHIQDDSMLNITAGHKNLSELYLDGCKLQQETLKNCLEPILKVSKNLKALGLSCNQVGESVLKLSHVPESLLELNLSHSSIIPNIGLQQLTDHLSETCHSLQLLDLSGNKVTPVTLVHLGKVRNNIQSLEIKYPDVPDKSNQLVAELCRTFSSNTCEVNLSNQIVSKEEAEAISMIIPQIKQVKVCNMSNMQVESTKQFPQVVLEAFCESEKPEMKILNLSHNKIHSDSFNKAAEIVPNLKNLNELNLEKCNIKDADLMSEFLDAISKHCSRLHVLDLTSNHMNPAALSAVISVNQKNPLLRQLTLANCNITNSKGVQELIKLNLESSTGLKVLDLAENQLNLETFLGLTELKYQRYIDVTYPRCTTSNPDLVRISKKKFSKIKKVFLANTEMTPDEQSALCQLINKTQSLEELDISHCSMQEGILSSLTKALLACSGCLRVLNMSGNVLNEEGELKFLQLLKKFVYMKILYLPLCKYQKDHIIESLLDPNICQQLEYLNVGEILMSSIVLLKLISWGHRSNIKIEHSEKFVSQCQSIVDLIKQGPHYWRVCPEINWHNPKIEDHDKEALDQLFVQLPKLERFCMKGCHFVNPEQKIVVSEWLKKVCKYSTEMQEINLSDNSVGPDVFAILAKSDRRMKVLEFSKCQIEDGDCLMSLEGMFRGITKLDLSNNNIGNAGCQSLLSLFKSCGTESHMNELNISKCNITDNDIMQNLIKCLEETDMHTLNMEGNEVDVKTTCFLTQYKRKGVKITYPTVAKCSKEIKALAFSDWSRLDKIELGEISLSSVETDALQFILEHSSEKQHISLDRTAFSADNDINCMLQAVCDQAGELSTLILTGQCHVNTSVLLEIIQKANKLAILRLDKCNISENKTEIIVDSLKTKRRAMQELNLAGNSAKPISMIRLHKLKKENLIDRLALPNVVSHTAILKDLSSGKNWKNISVPEHTTVCKELFEVLTEIVECEPTQRLTITETDVSEGVPWRSLIEKLLSNSKSLSDLIITNCNIQDEGLKFITDKLSLMKQLKNVSLVQCSVTQPSMKEFISCLSQNNLLIQRLDISKNKLSEELLMGLCAIFDSCSSLNSLSLAKCEYSDTICWRKFLAKIGKCATKSFKELDIRGNVLSPCMLLEISRLESVGIKVKHDENISECHKELVKLCKMKPDKLANIKVIELANSQGMTQDGISALETILHQTKELETFIWTKCKTEESLAFDEAIRALNDASGLKKLDISCNLLDDSSIDALVSVQFAYLKIMNLSKCGITYPNIYKLLGHITESSNQLQELNLSQNSFENTSTTLFFDAIKQLPKLAKLNLNNIGITKIDSIDSNKEEFPNLKELDFASNTVECCTSIVNLALFDKSHPNLSVKFPECFETITPDIDTVLRHKSKSFAEIEEIHIMESMSPHMIDALSKIITLVPELGSFSVEKVSNEKLEKILSSAIEKKCNFRELDFSGNDLNKDQSTVSSILSQSSHLTSLKLSRCCLSDPVALLKTVASECKSITSIDLTENTFVPSDDPNDDFQWQGEMFQKLETLELANCCVHKNKQSESFIRHLCSLTSLQTLNLENSQVSPSLFIMLHKSDKSLVSPLLVKTEMLQIHPSLVTDEKMEAKKWLTPLIDMCELNCVNKIDFSNNALGSEGLSILVNTLNKIPNLKALALQNCKVKADESFITLIRHLSTYSENLEDLDLAHNEIGECESIALDGFNRKLLKLNLQDTKLTIPNLQSLIHNISQTQEKIKQLNLSDNKCDLLSLVQLSRLERNRKMEVMFPECDEQDNKYLIDLCKGHIPEQVEVNYDNLSPTKIEAIAAVLSDWTELRSKEATAQPGVISLTGTQLSVDPILEALANIPEYVDELVLTKSRFSVEKVSKVVGANENIQILNLHDCGLSNEEMVELLTEIKTCETLLTLDLSGNIVSDEGLALLCDLNFLPGLEKLLLENCKITQGYGNLISKLKNHNDGMRILNLSGNSATLIDLVDLNQLGKERASEFGLILPKCEYPRSNMRKICESPEIWAEMREIKLGELHKPREGLQALVRVVSNSPQLSHLHLCGVSKSPNPEIDSCLSEVLKATFKHCKSITTIDLSKTHISKGVLKSIVDSLIHAKMLEALLLAECNIPTGTTETFLELVKALEKNCHIFKNLDLKGNTISPEVYLSLKMYAEKEVNVNYDETILKTFNKKVGALFKKTSAQLRAETSIDLSHESLTPDETKGLLFLLENITLKVNKLKLKGCQITESFTNEILKVTNNCRKLEKLDFRQNEFSSETMTRLIQSLPEWHALKKLRLGEFTIEKEEDIDPLSKALSDTEIDTLDLTSLRVSPEINLSKLKKKFPKIKNLCYLEGNKKIKTGKSKWSTVTSAASSALSYITGRSDSN